MCGRYLVGDEAYEDILEMLPENAASAASASDASLSGLFERREVFPTNSAPVIISEGVIIAKWGFPSWKNHGVIINARAETAIEKSMFQKSLMLHRCTVPSCGFFEWSHKSNGKPIDKYLLRQPDKQTLFMAGILKVFRDATGGYYNAFVILTTAANESVAPLHGRMPVILEQEEHKLWIEDNRFMQLATTRPGPELIPELYS